MKNKENITIGIIFIILMILFAVIGFLYQYWYWDGDIKCVINSNACKIIK